ncbi:hypothetical protein V6N13_100337 [Hibiscus sabdariffa]
MCGNRVLFLARYTVECEKLAAHIYSVKAVQHHRWLSSSRPSGPAQQKKPRAAPDSCKRNSVYHKALKPSYLRRIPRKPAPSTRTCDLLGEFQRVDQLSRALEGQQRMELD